MNILTHVSQASHHLQEGDGKLNKGVGWEIRREAGKSWNSRVGRDFTKIPRDSNNRDGECEVIKQKSFLKSEEKMPMTQNHFNEYIPLDYICKFSAITPRKSPFL